MQKKTVFSLFLFVFLFTVVSSQSIDSEIQKITSYAEDYEIGNIDYIQLQVYTSAVRSNLNEILGAVEKHEGGLLKQEQIRKALGEPQEETKWIWNEREEHDIKLKEAVPIWKKIIFDGEKIQMWIMAFPSQFKSKTGEESLVYRLHFETNFKKPQDQLDIQSRIDEIQELATIFNANPSHSNAETLAKQSVNTERTFENFLRQTQTKCEELMKSIFGSENKRTDQKILINDITFFSSEKLDAMIRLEMCDECEWNHINLNLWLDGRFRYPKEQIRINERELRKSFETFDDSRFESKTIKILEQIKQSLEQEDYESTLSYAQQLQILTQVWSENSNNVWEEVNQIFDFKIESMTEEERYKFDQDFGWIKQDQERRQQVKNIQKQNYENRKKFYLNLFFEYDTKEFYFTQTDFEKRLVEEFKEKGEEICSNNEDDNEDGQIDCDDSQCGGKICGQDATIIKNENETKEVIVDFYCIQGVCQAKEELNVTTTEPICGNHICEANETLSCVEDCTTCQEHPPIECEGKVIFKGEDKNGCSLEPICIKETVSCNTTDDCEQPLCGIAECVKVENENETGMCQVTELKECEEAECTEGEKQVELCPLSEEKMVTAICSEGEWLYLDSFCEASKENISSNDTIPLPEPIPVVPIAGEECVVKSDCGGENDVCSNGYCKTLPKKEPVHEPEDIQETPEEEEQPEEQQPEEPEEQESEQPEEPEESEQPEEQEQEQQEQPEEQEEPEQSITGQIISSIKKITGAIITGFEIADEGTEDETPQVSEESSEEESQTTTDKTEEVAIDGDNNVEENFDKPENYVDENTVNHEDEWKDDSDDWEQRENEDWERHEREQRERCENDCNRPCIDRCTREACGEQMDCDIEEEIKICESSCEPEEDCVDKCTRGEEDWWKEFENEEEHKQEKGVFQVGGGCRTSKGKTEGFIYFGGWGDPFEGIQDLKHKYYSGGEADWCKNDLENYIRQRQEFERGFNQEFAQWFFEKYLANSAENWEQASSGIFELYWQNVDNQREMAHRMKCLGKDDINEVMDFNLINFEYETEFGKLEYWEEIKTIELNDNEEKGEVTIISPYMKIWIFPPESFIKYEMKKSMQNHEFPGPPEEKMERKNEEGLTDEEKEAIREDKKFMKMIKEISEKYGGNVNTLLQIVDRETDEIIFNLYIKINEQDIIEIKPMLPEEAPTPDITIKLDFDKLYDMILFSEKEMRGAEMESPPWDQKPRHGKIKGLTNGVKMYFKARNLFNSAEVIPKEAEKDAMNMLKAFMKMAGDKGDDKDDRKNDEDKGEKDFDVWEDKEVLTGEVTSNL